MNGDDKTDSDTEEAEGTCWVLLPAELLSLLAVGETRKLRFRPPTGALLELLVVRDDKGLTAIDTLCPHAGGRFEDELDEHGATRCPLHDLHFDPRTGESVGQACRPATIYPLRFSRAGLEVGLPTEAVLVDQ